MLDWRANFPERNLDAEHVKGKEAAAQLGLEFGFDVSTLTVRELSILELAVIRVEAYKSQARVLSDRLRAMTLGSAPAQVIGSIPAKTERDLFGNGLND